jgi:hypothetical protein
MKRPSSTVAIEPQRETQSGQKPGTWLVLFEGPEAIPRSLSQSSKISKA